MTSATHRRNVILAIAAAVAVVLWLGTWFVVAVIVPLVQEAPCSGIEFGPHVPSVPGPPRERPPIGGTGGLAGALRSALRAPGEAVYCNDFADPFVLRDGRNYYVYATNTEKFHIPVLTSGGLFGTARVSEALPDLPAWTTSGKVWAPAVLARPGKYVMYYATAAPDPNAECISVATAAAPQGPFVDRSSGPLICPPGGGAIDPSPTVGADGRVYLLWKEYDGVTGIVSQELSADGVDLIGEPRLLVSADQAWEAGVVEGPSMLEHEGRSYLFYSANHWPTADYAMGYAICDTPLGPCAKPPSGPWLASTDQAQGPGGGDVFVDQHGQPWLALHAWVRGRVGYPSGVRNLFVVPITFQDGAPVAA